MFLASSNLAPPIIRSKNAVTKPGKSLLRRLFPLAQTHARARLAEFRFHTLPLLRLQAHSRIYRLFNFRSQLLRQRQRQRLPTGFFSRFRKRSRLFWLGGASRNAAASRKYMISTAVRDDTSTRHNMEPLRFDGREPGRRRKLAGYLRAANELRQTYQQNYLQSGKNRDGPSDTDDMPGAFPGAVTTRDGDEQMVIFPSYARRHVKQKVRNSKSSLSIR